MSGDRIIFSYSRRDEEWRGLLERHLNVLVTQEIAEIWTDRRIGAGKIWEREILRAIDSARLAILLVSADFLGSEFILNVEVPRILERQQAGKLSVVPVLVQPCLWQVVPWLQEIQMLPRDDYPLSSLRGHRKEREVVTIAKEILGILRPDLSITPRNNTPTIAPAGPNGGA